MNIKKRDLVFFLLGLFSFLVIETIINWGEVKKDMRRGFNDATGQESVESTQE
jgi:hypothetical protein